MWKSDHLNLEELITFLINNIEFHPKTGFSFCSVTCGNQFSEAFRLIGKPENYNTESDQQQTAAYLASIDHPEHGKRDHHQLKLLLWAFNQEPISILKLHFYYYSTGPEAELFHASVTDFCNRIIEKLGPPDLKKLTKGKQELFYQIGSSKLRIWNNSEGVRIELK